MRNLLTFILFIAMTAAQAQSWTNRFLGPGYGDLAVSSIAADRDGNVFVTGSSLDANTNSMCLTLKYSSAGTALWTNYYPLAMGTALVVDTNGNVFVTGSAEGDYLTIKYSGAGIPNWTNRYDGAGGPDWANAIALDHQGDVIVTGGSEGTAIDETYTDYATVKYTSAGEPVWTNRFNGSMEWGFNLKLDEAKALAVDTDGNVIVTGESVHDDPMQNDYYDFVTIKYSPAGVPLWTNRYDGPGKWYERSPSVAVDGNGDILVAGTSEGLNGSGAYFATIKYSSSGEALWTQLYGSSDTFPAAKGLAVDKNGNVFVTGYDTDTNLASDYLTIKYSGAGLPLWTNRYGMETNSDDSATAIAVDRSGNVHVTGDSFGLSSNHDIATISYSTDGSPLSTNRYDGTGNYDYGHAITVDPNGNVFVTGRSRRSGFFDLVTIKYAAEIPAPKLSLHYFANSIVLSWTDTSCALQSAPSITGTFTNVPGASSPYTNSISGEQRYFRLAR